MISILTYTPSLVNIEKVKTWIKCLIGRQRGPDMVLSNLENSLEKKHFHFLINKIDKNTDKVHVISGINCLEWAIQKKDLGKISELIAGPNITLTPKDYNSLLENNAIDKIIVPSAWVAEFYSNISPEIKNKLYIWPVGVECNIDETKTERNICLIYKKSVDEKLFTDVKKYLEDSNISYKVIEYGKYKRSEYFDLLKQTKFMIYLQESESQGIALQEAWSYNVPTLVWNQIRNYPWNDKGFYESKETGLQIKYALSAPYLTEESGMFFKDFNEFKIIFNSFINKLITFKPSLYCKQNLSLEKSAEIYINIIENIQKPWSK